MGELGIVAAKGYDGLKMLLAIIADASDARVPEDARASLSAIVAQLADSQEQIVAIEKRLLRSTCKNADSKRLGTIPGIGVIVAAPEMGAIHAAALDTFAQEPPVGSPLLGRDDVVVTPTSPARPTTISSSSCAAASTTFIDSLRASRSRQQRWSSLRTMAAHLCMS